MANEAIWTINLQYRRLNSDEPEDNYFAFRKWADIHFLLIALLKLKKAARIALTIKEISPCIQKAINNFDRKLPKIQTMRNVLEHIDLYSTGKGNNKNIDKKDLEVSFFKKENVFCWLDFELDIDLAFVASEELYMEIKKCDPEK